MKTPEEIQEQLERIAYQMVMNHYYRRENTALPGELSMLSWFTGIKYENDFLYALGEKLYKEGWKFEWDAKEQKYRKYQKYIVKAKEK